MSKQEPSSANKWADFHKMQTSTIDLAALITRPPSDQFSYANDLRRADSAEDGCQTFINGQSLTEIASKRFNSFKTDKDVDDFITQVLLKSIPDENKNAALNYLKENLYQGRLLMPVKSAVELATPSIQEVKNIQEKNILFQFRDSMIKQRLDITITDKGFKIQEKLIAEEVIAHGGPLAEVATHSVVSSSEKGKAIIMAKGTIDIDFKEDPSKPEITVESSNIHYGHPILKQYMGKQSLLDMLVDFIKSTLGLNKYSVVTPEKPTDTAEPSDPITPGFF